MRKYHSLSNEEILQTSGGGSVCAAIFNGISAIPVYFATHTGAIAAKIPNVATFDQAGNPVLVNGNVVMDMSPHFYRQVAFAALWTSAGIVLQAVKTGVCD